MRNQTCCFTGHRHIPPEALPALSAQLETTVRGLISSGFCYFGAGGALGFDTIAAETVLRLRAEFPQIRLILVLPCRDQASGWPESNAARYKDILKRADKFVYVSDNYRPGCMQKRNRRLVDNSSACVAYCTRQTGGSAYTIDYARKNGLNILLLGK